MTGRPASELEVALLAYDGKHADVLKELCSEFAPTAAVLRRAVKLCGHDNVHLAQGASWLLWTWLTAGAKATPRLIVELAQLLPRIDDKWVQLHLVRCVPLVVVAPDQVPEVVAFLQRCLLAKLPFLRAWAVDSLHRLALQHETVAGEARRAMEDGAVDPAPSVRKRVEKILHGR